MQRTIEVEHPGAHEPTIEQLRAAVVSSLKEEGLRLDGGYSARIKVSTSGGPSTYVVTFDAEEVNVRPKRAAKKAEGFDHSAVKTPEHPTIDDADIEKL